MRVLHVSGLPAGGPASAGAAAEHNDFVRAVAVMRDGRVVSGSGDKSLRCALAWGDLPF